MKPNHLLAGILLPIAMSIGIALAGQVKMVDVMAPPEIKLLPSPSRVVVFRDLSEGELQLLRQKKEDLVDECRDTLLSVFTRTIRDQLPSIEWIWVPAHEIDDSLKMPYPLLQRYQADLALCVANFSPAVRQGEVTRTVNDDNSKSKSAQYSMVASGVLRIYNSDSLLKSFPFSESQFLQDRAVVSGLLAAGPSLVKNKPSALSVSDRAAHTLVEMFVSQPAPYMVSLFKKKELNEVTSLIGQNNYEEALRKALQLTGNEDEAVSSRAHYLCALLYHMQMDFPKAFEHAQHARAIKKLAAKGDWNSYYYFLKKFVVDNQVVWKNP